LIGGVFYIIFCDGNVQPWAVTSNDEEEQNKDEDEKKKVKPTTEQEALEMEKYTRL
jgi:hypothetical protein